MAALPARRPLARRGAVPSLMVDVAVVGGGIAGVSVAARLSDRAEVLLIEAEPTLAFHATGRSAALFFESYGHRTTRPLTRMSHVFFRDPPSRYVDGPLLRRRGALTIGRPDDRDALERQSKEAERAGGRSELVTTDTLLELCPVIRTDRFPHGLWEPDASDMDVAALHQGFVRWLRSNGGVVQTGSPLTEARRAGSVWKIVAGGTTVEAEVLVNAAGAWGDAVAERSGVAPIGLRPKRRTVFMTSAPPASEPWPVVVDQGHTFYFKPDGTQLLCSPADETPGPADDARPRESDIALAIERINEATRLGIRSVRSSWAGQRTFAPDGAMVIGFEPDVDGFFWLVGQGGTGIQTAPAASALAASLITSRTPAAEFEGTELQLAALSPKRFRSP